MTAGDDQQTPRGEKPYPADTLTIDDVIERVRPLTAISPIRTSDILDAIDEGGQSRDI